EPSSLIERNRLRLRRPFHSLLVILLPDLRPGAAVHVGHLVGDYGARDGRAGEALHRKDRLHAFDERIRVAHLEAADALERPRHSDGLHERLGVVEDALVVEAHEAAAGVAPRRVDLDRLQLPREFGIAVYLPALDVRGPGDQRVAVPESDRVAVPARHFGPE